jgi:pyrimidine operon attenuation protein/uracil phosphoribosyltransferase
MPQSVPILDAAAMKRALTRIAHEIAERNEHSRAVVLAGIPSGGEHLARRIATVLETIWGHPVPVGTLDVGMHRDDLAHNAAPTVRPTVMPCDINGRVVVLVDDVLYSGRTTRAAMDALTDLGRPRCIQLAVLVDRGHRELPIKADFVGKNVPTARAERIDVRLAEDGGEDRVTLERP